MSAKTKRPSLDDPHVVTGLFDDIAARLYSERKRAGLTQTRLGEMVGMASSAVSRHECNHVGIGVLTLYRYADALGISVHDLLPPRAGGAS